MVRACHDRAVGFRNAGRHGSLNAPPRTGLSRPREPNPVGVLAGGVLRVLERRHLRDRLWFTPHRETGTKAPP